MSGRIKVYEDCREPYNKELMQLFGDLHNLSFVRISQLNWVGHVNRLDSKRKVSLVYENNPQGSRIRGQPKNRWWNFVQTYINKYKITNWKEVSKNGAAWEKSIK